MPSFRWSAINGGGEVVHGVMEAPDRAWVVDRLQRQGQTVLRADPADLRRGLGDLLADRDRRSAPARQERDQRSHPRAGDHARGGAGSRPGPALCCRQYPQCAHAHDPRPGPRQGPVRQLARCRAFERTAQLFEALHRDGARRRSGRDVACYPRPAGGIARARTRLNSQPARGDDLPGVACGSGDRLDHVAAGLRAAAIYPNL